MFGVRVDCAGDSDASSATMASVDSQHVCILSTGSVTGC